MNKLGKDSLNTEDLTKYEVVNVEIFYKADDIFSSDAHVAVVDLDKETGFVKVIEYYAVDDVGKVLNREEVEGQIVGGILQGVSQVIIEAMRYDERGIPLCSSIADCGVSTVFEAPLKITQEYVEYPSQLLSGSKGVGKAGTTGALPAVFIAFEKAAKKKFNITPIDPWIVT